VDAVHPPLLPDCTASVPGRQSSSNTVIFFFQVRYSQLRKAQEKLIGDLENCVSKRDTIVERAETRKAHKGNHNTHHGFQKKLEDIRNKVKQVNSVGNSLATFMISDQYWLRRTYLHLSSAILQEA
jgi:hypothetical protein